MLGFLIYFIVQRISAGIQGGAFGKKTIPKVKVADV